QYFWQYGVDNYYFTKRDHGRNLPFYEGLPPNCAHGRYDVPDIHVPSGSHQVYVTCDGSLYWRPDDQLAKEQCTAAAIANATGLRVQADLQIRSGPILPSETGNPNLALCNFQRITDAPSGAFRSLYDPFSRRFFVGTSNGQIFGTSGTPDQGNIW